MLTTPVSLRTASGPRGSRPNTKTHGGTPVVSFGHSLKAHNAKPKYLCHALGWSIANLLTMFFNVPIRRSHKPVCCGLPGTLKQGLQPNIDRKVLVNWLVKFVAQSDFMTDGIPVV